MAALRGGLHGGGALVAAVRRAHRGAACPRCGASGLAHARRVVIEAAALGDAIEISRRCRGCGAIVREVLRF